MNDTELAGLLGFGKADNSPTLAWGKVLGVSGDTVTANVMGGTVSAVRCCGCSVGDIVALEGQRGRWRAIGRKGGEGGSSIDLPLSMANGGTGAAYADALALANGLQLYSLGLGTEIHDNDNLNNYKTYGVYRITSNATLQTLTGKPDSSCLSTACTLIVRAGHISGYPIQEIISRISGNRAIRQWEGSSWSDWAFYGGMDSIIAEGTSGNWSYSKYANGTFFAICRIPAASYAITTAHSTLYKTAEQSTSLPFTNVELSYAGGSASSSNLIIAARHNGSNVVWRIYNSTSTTGSYSVRLFVYGRWK